MNTVRSPSLDSLIDRQARLWEVRNRLAEEGGAVARRELVHLEEGPWLTVSRQLGTGGLEIARRVAASLGWQAFDKEILASIAEHHHLRRRVVERLDERVVGWIAETVNHLMTPQSLPQAAFAKDLAAVVLALARQGRAVIVGRGANWMLDARYGLRVRVIAPVEHRITEIARRRGVDRARAARDVREHDAMTSAFIRQTFGRAADDPYGYDLVLNVESIEVDRASEVVREALRYKLGGA